MSSQWGQETNTTQTEEGQQDQGSDRWRSHSADRPLVCRALRGAIGVEENSKEQIIARTAQLLKAIVEANDLHTEDIVSAFFTATPDLNAEYPAVAARSQLGWHDVPLMCGQEMAVPGSLPMCLRVLIHWNTTLRNDELIHVYLGRATVLRPDHVDKLNGKK
ncbi:MAG: chorismate mutase [Anaerolineae bacterium]